MDRLAAVRFNNVGKYYYFSTNLDLHKGDKVIVETVRGLELGELITELKDLSDFKIDAELKPIKRIANRADIEVYEINQTKAKKSFDICKDIIKESKLDMRLINCEYTLDASKVIFMYTADERVDFRELLKELAGIFKCRIELRQVGPRDKAKIVGGIGNCGLQLCCASFLGEFDGVSINMAKNQMLAINIDKISGACGRLLCCLKYEDEAYTELKKKFPKIGTRLPYDNKMVKVVGLNVISELVKIDDEGSISFVTLDEIRSGKPAPKQEDKTEPHDFILEREVKQPSQNSNNRQKNNQHKNQNNNRNNNNSNKQKPGDNKQKKHNNNNNNHPRRKHKKGNKGNEQGSH